MNRLAALSKIEETTRDWAVVLTCGATAREMAALSRPDRHLPLLDSMGLTSAVGLGVALGTSARVGVVDGDGSLLMGFSILPTLATLRPKNLTVVVLDNHQHASADEMDSQSASFDLVSACSGFGFPVTVADDEASLAAALTGAGTGMSAQFSLVVANIEPGNAAGVPLLLADPAVVAEAFRIGVGSLS